MSARLIMVRLKGRARRRLTRLRWRVKGVRMVTGTPGVTVDRAGYYEVRTTMLISRNGKPETTSHVMQQTVYCNVGDVIEPTAIADMAGHLIGRAL